MSESEEKGWSKHAKEYSSKRLSISRRRMVLIIWLLCGLAIGFSIGFRVAS